MKLVVIGDIHAQSAKLWSMLDDAGVADAAKRPTAPVLDGDVRIVLLGDLVHAKSRERYGELIGAKRYDEYDPAHLARAERAQVDFLRDVRAFQSAAPDGAVTILMGNHDFNAVQADQGPLRTDDVTHLEWKDGHGSALPEPLREWIRSWPYELEIDGLHFAHVGPLEEHNRYDNGFYLENRRRWIYEERDYLDGTFFDTWGESAGSPPAFSSFLASFPSPASVSCFAGP